MLGEKHDHAFLELFGRRPTKEEVDDLVRLQRVLGIRSDDALWSVIIALRYHVTLMREVPEEVATASEKVAESTVKRQAAAIAKLEAETASKLAGAVEKAAVEAARTYGDAQRKKALSELMQWAITAVAIIAGLLYCAGYVWYNKGEDAGFAEGQKAGEKAGIEAGRKIGAAEGYEKAKSEKAAAAWAQTAEGKLAQEVAKTGLLRMVADCTGHGWRAEGGSCIAAPGRDGRVQTWRLPGAHSTPEAPPQR